MSIALPVAFSTWSALLNNFVIEQAGFTGVEIGILQSLREVPGFLAFTTVFVLLIIREQPFAVVALALLGIGVALAGVFPTPIGLYCTTILMSTGFHYFEVLKQSLALQWFSKEEAPQAMGKLISVGAITSLIVYVVLWCLLELLQLDYIWIYMIAGGLCCCFAVFMWIAFPPFQGRTRADDKPRTTQALLAFLRVEVFLRRTPPNIYRLCGIPDGRAIRLHRLSSGAVIPDQLRLQLAICRKDRRIDRSDRRAQCVEY